MFDSILTVLDQNERKLIVTNVIKGICREKTVVLITNFVELVHECDRVAIV